MIDNKRRLLLKGSMAAGALGAAVGTGLLTPRMALAAWPEGAFEADSVAATLEALYGTAEHEPSDAVSVKVPPIAENGAVVPVTVETELEGVESITIIAAENQTPLIATFELGEGMLGFASTRIKMAKTGNVVAVVKVGDKLYSAAQEVKVTIGGCGG